MRKARVLPVLLALLLALSLPAYAQTDIFLRGTLAEEIARPLREATGGTFRLIHGFCPGGDPNMVCVLLNEQGTIRLHILKRMFEGEPWVLHVSSAPLPEIGGHTPYLSPQSATRFLIVFESDTTFIGQSSNFYAFTFQQEDASDWRLYEYNTRCAANGQTAHLNARAHDDYIALSASSAEGTVRAYGSYSRDLRTIDLAALPYSLEDAHSLPLESLAMVANPNAEERLHLRARPDQSAQTLGKYYNGVVVTVLDVRTDGWTNVRIGGNTGYMMSQYLAVGHEAFDAVEKVPLERITLRETALMNRPEPGASTIARLTQGEPVTILAVIPDTPWAHVRVEGQTGYVNASDIGRAQ